MKLIVRGKALPQERPRFFRRGSFVGAYDPGKSRNWKDDIKSQAIALKATIQEGPLYLSVNFFLLRPASVTVKKRPFPNVRPDLDNFIKAVKDALNGICWTDDGQVVQLAATKQYTSDDPRVEIEILPAFGIDNLSTMPLFENASKPKELLPEDFGFAPDDEFNALLERAF